MAARKRTSRPPKPGADDTDHSPEPASTNAPAEGDDPMPVDAREGDDPHPGDDEASFDPVARAARAAALDELEWQAARDRFGPSLAPSGSAAAAPLDPDDSADTPPEHPATRVAPPTAPANDAAPEGGVHLEDTPVPGAPDAYATTKSAPDAPAPTESAADLRFAPESGVFEGERGGVEGGGDAFGPKLDDPSASEGVSRAHLRGLLEALLFMSHEPLALGRLCEAAAAERPVVKQLLDELREFYRSRGVRLDETAGGWQFRTNPAYAPFLRESTAQKPAKLTRAQVETLAIVAYRQPVTRPEVDDVRGVDSGPMLKLLLERDLVRIMGKREEPGRPILYGTSSEFLAFFGLKSLRDLPTLREFSELTDDSRRVFTRELGEEPPAGPLFEGGLPGAEGSVGPAQERVPIDVASGAALDAGPTGDEPAATSDDRGVGHDAGGDQARETSATPDENVSAAGAEGGEGVTSAPMLADVEHANEAVRTGDQGAREGAAPRDERSEPEVATDDVPLRATESLPSAGGVPAGEPASDHDSIAVPDVAPAARFTEGDEREQEAGGGAKGEPSAEGHSADEGLARGEVTEERWPEGRSADVGAPSERLDDDEGSERPPGGQ